MGLFLYLKSNKKEVIKRNLDGILKGLLRDTIGADYSYFLVVSLSEVNRKNFQSNADNPHESYLK